MSAGQARKLEASKESKKLSIVKTFSAAGEEVPDAFIFAAKNVKAEWKLACGRDSLVLANDVGSVTSFEWQEYVTKALIPHLIQVRSKQSLEHQQRKMLLYVDG